METNTSSHREYEDALHRARLLLEILVITVNPLWIARGLRSGWFR